MSTEDLEGDVQVAKYLERYDKALITNYRAFRLLARGWAGWPFFGRRKALVAEGHPRSL